MTGPTIAVLVAGGTNCDEETASAVSLAEGVPWRVALSECVARPRLLRDVQGLVLPGGFSNGDHIAAGRILARQLKAHCQEELDRFLEAKKPILGICNGFQVLVQLRLLPGALVRNEKRSFECRWVRVFVSASDAGFTKGLTGRVLTLPVAHGEGRFVASDDVMQSISSTGGIALRYANENGRGTMRYPANPNGSESAIAGVTSADGRVFGLMPHPERFVQKEHHPNWRRNRGTSSDPHGILLFRNFVRMAADV